MPSVYTFMGRITLVLWTLIFGQPEHALVNANGDVVYLSDENFTYSEGKILHSNWNGESFDQTCTNLHGDTLFVLEDLNCSRFRNGFAEITHVERGISLISKYSHGVINSIGEIIVPPDYDDIMNSQPRTIFIAKEESDSLVHNWFVFNSAGQNLWSIEAQDLKGFYQERALIKQDNKYGYLNTRGEVAVDLQFEDASSFGTSVENLQSHVSPLARVKINGLWGAIDTSGKFVVPAQFDSLLAFHSEYAAFLKDGYWGFVDTTGFEIISARFKNVWFFTNELAAATHDGISWGYIDINGEWIIAPDFEETNFFVGGVAPVKINGTWGLINTSGKFLVPPKYSGIQHFNAPLINLFDGKAYDYCILVPGGSPIKFDLRINSIMDSDSYYSVMGWGLK